MNNTPRNLFSVASAPGRIEKGVEPRPSTPPRLPDPQNISFPSVSHKKHVPVTMHNPFSFCSNKNFSQIQGKPILTPKKPMISTLSNPFPFCSSKNFSSQNARVPTSIVEPPLDFLPSNQSSFASTSTFNLTTTTYNSHTDPSRPLSAAYVQITPPPRKPVTGREIAYNTLRPQIAAADRLFSWCTLHGIRHDNNLLGNLPSQLIETAKSSIRGAFAPSTRSTYGAGILRFNQFCDRWSIPESDRMPASYALLCAFIGEHKATVSGKTIKSWLSGIRAFHLVNRAEWLGDDAWVKMARISASKEGSRHRRPLRSPVSIEHLLTLLRALNLPNPFHAAVWAVATTTFFGCRRLGETLITSVSSFNEKYHVL